MANSQWPWQWAQEVEFLMILVLVRIVCFISLAILFALGMIRETPLAHELCSLGIDQAPGQFDQDLSTLLR